MANVVTMRPLLYIAALTLLTSLSACDDVKRPTDTPASGSMILSADETYQPVIEQQMHVFDSSFPKAHITVQYKPESACIEDFMNGKSKMILVTRELSQQENDYCMQHGLVPSSDKLARDAVAVIVNPASPDTVFNLEQLRSIITGRFARKYTVVFDNEGSSSVRFIQDSLLKKGDKIANGTAAKSNPAVVDYVAANPNAIGFIGLSYISDDRDSTAGAYLNKIKVAYVQQSDSIREFYKPSQARIATREYPLSRNLYYIKNENYLGIASGLTGFLMHERGQLIFKQAMLFPLQVPIIIKEAEINTAPIK